MSIQSVLVNRMFLKGDNKRDEGLTTPDTITRHDDIAYADGGKYNLLDVYYPKGTDKKLPAIINIHGGGWVYGTKETYQFYLMELASYGFTVVNPNYRLAPKAKFPAQLEDINNAVKWALSNADEYHIDKVNVFFVGDSAGAHLNTLYTAFLTDAVYSANFDFNPPEGFMPNAIILNCGAYTIKENIEQRTATRPLMRDFMGRRGLKDSVHLIDAISLVNDNFPPVYLMSATGDFLLSQIEPMKEKLTSLNIPHMMKIYGTQENKLPHVFNVNIKSEDAKVCNTDEMNFLKSYIK